MFWGDTRKMRKIKAAARGTARKPMSLLSAAVAAALLAGIAVPAFAQSADAGQVGDPSSWHDDEFNADWGLAAIGADYAYARGLSGKGIRLGIFDSGSGLDHPEFAGKNNHALTIADMLEDGSRCTNTTILGGPGACFSSVGDQVAIDYVGYNANVPENIRRLIESGPYVQAGASYNTHGTHVAGTMVANRDGSGTQGVAYAADITAAKLFFNSASEWRRTSSGYSVVDLAPQLGPSDGAIQDMYAQMNADGVRAINHSWGLSNEPSAALMDLYYADEGTREYLDIFAQGSRDSGLIQVWAAGNTSSVIATPAQSPIAGLYATLPRAFPDIEKYWLSVVNVNEDLVLSNRSNRCGLSAEWCVAAPGSDIASTVYGDDSSLEAHTTVDADGNIILDVTKSEPDYGYGYMSGTSMAAPHVTGALALLMERFPYLDNAQIRDVLLTTATDLGAPGVDDIYGWGLINLKKAIEGPGLLRVDTDVVMNQRAGGTKVWEGNAWDDWSNDIGGPGRLTKSGIGWLRLSGNNGFAGADVAQGILELTGDNHFTANLKVNGGVLMLNGSVTGTDLDIDSGMAVVNGVQHGGSTRVGVNGFLGGNGTLSDTRVEGTIAPGNSIGKLTIDGNYVQAAGSTYVAEILPPSTSDALQVNGTATLEGGTLKMVLTSGEYALGNHYVLLSATGGITGTFDALDTSAVSPFLGFKVGYAANGISVDVGRGLSLAAAAATPNQRAAGAAVDTLAIGQGLTQPLVQLFPAQAMAALDQLDGELHATAQAVRIESSRRLRDLALGRAGIGQDGFTAQSDATGYAAWVDAGHVGGHLDGDGNAARAEYSGNSTLVGAEYGFDSGWRIGVMGGSGRNDLNVRDRASKARIDSTMGGLYAGKSWGGLGLRGGLTFSKDDLSSHRRVAFSGVQDQTHADYKADTTQGFVELGYRMGAGAWEFEPYAQFAQVRVDGKRFAENGGVSALSGKAEDMRTDLATGGVRFNVNLKGAAQQQSWLSLRGGLAYRHADGDRLPTATVAWQGGDAFGVQGTPLAKDSTVLEAGIGARLNERVLLEIGYSGQWSDEARDDAANARLSVQF